MYIHMVYLYNCRYEDKENKSNFSDSNSIHVMVVDKKLLSNPDSNAIDIDLDQETTNDTCLLEDTSSINLDLSHLNIDDNISSAVCYSDSSNNEKSIEDGVNDNDTSIPVMHLFANISFEGCGNESNVHTIIANLDHVKNSNNILESVLKDRTIKADDTVNGNLKHQRYISQNQNIDKNVTSMPKKVLKKHSITSTNSVVNHNAPWCKIFIIFAVCCTIGIFLIPITLYFVNQTRDNTEVDSPEYSHKRNTSNVVVRYKPSSQLYLCILYF